MFNVLITGKLTKGPKISTGKNGQPYCTASLRVPVQAQREDDADFAYASVIAFGTDAEKLSRLEIGDAVSLTGSARVIQWEREGQTQSGINVTVSGILSAYEVRKRRGMNEGRPEPRTHRSPPARPDLERQTPALLASSEDPDDILSF